MKSLVAYFSATGTTATVAKKLSAAAGADLYEIKPKVNYTDEDLNWMDDKSRSSIEMNNKQNRPEIITGDIDISIYDVVYLGFPIWWYVAPTVINTFLESYDFANKKIVLFATSGGSGFGNTINELKVSATDADFVVGRLMNGKVTDESLKEVISLG